MTRTTLAAQDIQARTRTVLGEMAVPLALRGARLDAQIVSPNWEDAGWSAEILIERSEDGGLTWQPAGQTVFTSRWKTVTCAGGGDLPALGIETTVTTTHVRIAATGDAPKRIGFALVLAERLAPVRRGA